jgi:hypothetical protein
VKPLQLRAQRAIQDDVVRERSAVATVRGDRTSLSNATTEPPGVSDTWNVVAFGTLTTQYAFGGGRIACTELWVGYVVARNSTSSPTARPCADDVVNQSLAVTAVTATASGLLPSNQQLLKAVSSVLGDRCR